jgi:2-oxoglutarate ferredoxin oxidoreductase subunit gamma
MADIICAGFGGQGILTAGLILAQTGMENGRHVTWIPSYGSEMRGGTANCGVKISEEPIASPFVKKADILLAMNRPSVDRFSGLLRPGALLVSNRSIVRDARFRADVRAVEVDATELAERLGNPKGANVVMLGALAAAGGLFEGGVLLRGVEGFFEKKGRSNPKNRPCFEAGFQAARGRP